MHSSPLALWPVPRVPTSVSRVFARTADACVLPAFLPAPLAVSSSADRAPPRSVRPDAAGFDALLTTLCASSGTAVRTRAPPVPLPFPCAVSRVLSSAARALPCPVCLPSSVAAGLGALPVPLPSLLAACALACPLRLPLGAPPVASHSPLRAPVAGILPRPRTDPTLPYHAPGVLLPLLLRQR